MKVFDYAMRVKFYGTRGSIPVCSRNFQFYGGNTSCLAIAIPGNQVVSIVDAGTGIRALGKEIMEMEGGIPKEITICFSHFHWDHIQGFPFFTPAYLAAVKMNILMMGKDWKVDRLKKVMFSQMGGDFFPVEMDKMGAQFNFMALGNKVIQRSTRTTVYSRLHNHPGGAYSFRIERGGKVLVIVTDIEHGETIDPGTVELARDADLLIHEAQYTDAELKQRKGWGHSSYRQAIEVAKLSGAKQLIMTHHDPDHDDDFLADMERKCQKEFPNSSLAKEMMEVYI